MRIFNLALLLLTAYACCTNALPPLVYALRNRNGKYVIHLDILYVAIVFLTSFFRNNQHIFVLSITDNNIHETKLPIEFLKWQSSIFNTNFWSTRYAPKIRKLIQILYSVAHDDFLKGKRTIENESTRDKKMQNMAMRILRYLPLILRGEEGDIGNIIFK